MVKEVYDDIYQIKVRLPNNPLKELNVFLIKGEDRSLLIDTGFNMKESREDLFGGLEELGMDLEDIDVFLTHVHADHSGLAFKFLETSEHIYAGEIDGPLTNRMTNEKYWKEFGKNIDLFDLKRDGVNYHDSPGYKFASEIEIDFDLLKEGDVLKIGKYRLEVIDTPGHTPGQIGLYEREHKLYFSGDHVLDQITPNISFWGFEDNYLKTYIKMLKKVRDLDIDYIFPAHRNIMKDHPRRVDEIIKHHEDRIEEVYNILTEEPESVRNITSQMTWRIRANSWEEFPPAQKWFASGEAMTHLEYLVHEGRAKREKQNDTLYYSLA